MAAVCEVAIARLQPHQPDVALQRHFQLHIAVQRGQRHEIGQCVHLRGRSLLRTGGNSLCFGPWRRIRAPISIS